jgi:hypothetical protein
MKRKIFQGDSLSPLLFALGYSLSEQFNKLKTGYEEHTTTTKYHICFTWLI